MDVHSLVEVAPRNRFERVCALTGAGISVAAGLGTFRGPDGLWTLSPEMERAMHAHLLPGNVDALWGVWGGMWELAAAAGADARASRARRRRRLRGHAERRRAAPGSGLA
jgi:NAD-dependent deacetylase